MAVLAERRHVMGSRVRLVPLGENHLDATLQWVNDPVMMRLLGRTAPVEPDEHQRWFLRLHTRTDCRYFAVETVDSGQHVGNVWLWDINAADHKSEMRVLFGDEASRGHGYGSEAIALLADLAFTTFDLHRLYAYVFARNPRAKRAFEKAGFKVEGLLKQERRLGNEFIDVYLLARLAADEKQP
jgi:RimJ/RimL family protein N-acetyltransferase